MKIQFIYPAFERHAQANPILREYVPCNEYVGSPSLGIACIAACTPPHMEVAFVDDRVNPVDDRSLPEADLYSLSFFTAAASRAIELGDWLRAKGKKVVMGGIFPTMMPDEVAPHCDAVIVGEGETVWPEVCRDAEAGTLKPRYQAAGPIDLTTLPPPRIDLYVDAEHPDVPIDDYPLQISRGCPLSCSACALPGCMGTKIRFFSDDYVWKTLAAFSRRGKRLCLTEDTSFLFVSGARRALRALLQKIGDNRAEIGCELSYLGTSMPMLLHLDPVVFEEARRAGLHRFYLVGGFDPVTRGAFGPGDPTMLAKAEECIARCFDHGVEPYVSFLLGNEQDDLGTMDRMLEFSEKTKLNIAEFAVATPYPGTPMWHQMVSEDRLLTRTWKHYNDANVVFRPKGFTPEQLKEGYLYLWREFYRPSMHLKEANYISRTVQF
jgi:radical SAM superfamily enzyme YgiQ (UPF0313 family)